MEPVSLWANNVRLALRPFKLGFREVGGSCRQEIAAALGRLKAQGVTLVSVRDITNEVNAFGELWSIDTIGAAVRRDARQQREWAEPLPLQREGFARYRIQ